MLCHPKNEKCGQNRWISTRQKLRSSCMRNATNNPENLSGVLYICLCFLGGLGIKFFCPLLIFWEEERFGVFMGQSTDASRVQKRSASCADRIWAISDPRRELPHVPIGWRKSQFFVATPLNTHVSLTESQSGRSLSLS